MNSDPNNLYRVDDEQQPTQSGPMITGLPENQYYPPQSTPYMQPIDQNYSEKETPQIQPENPIPVDPFTPPEYESVNSNGDGQKKEEILLDQNLEIANWEAQDSVIGEKNKLWYVLFTIAVIALAAVAWFIGSWTFAALILVSAVAIIVSRTSSAARVVSYSLSGMGFFIDGKLHEYNQFKSFGILKEPGVFSIVFLPKKRFSTSVSIYFAEQDGEKIVDIIGARLPMEEIHPDIIDKIVRKLKL